MSRKSTNPPVTVEVTINVHDHTTGEYTSKTITGPFAMLVMETDDGQIFSGALGCGCTSSVAAAHNAFTELFDEIFRDYPKALLLLTLNEMRDMPGTLGRANIMKAIMRALEDIEQPDTPTEGLFKSKRPSDFGSALDELLHKGDIPDGITTDHTFTTPDVEALGAIARELDDEVEKAKQDTNQLLQDKLKKLFDNRPLPPA